jgi:NADH dehydrogenase
VSGGAARTVAVTGAAGFVGGALCRALVRHGFTVRALVRDRSAARLDPALQRARCALPDGIDPRAFEGVDVLVHAAWATRETDAAKARLVNEDGTRRLLDAARRASVRSRVFLSSIAARPDAPSYYGRSKWEAERLFDDPADLIVRPGLVLGPGGQGLFQQLLGAAERLHVVPLFAGGRQPLHTVHIDDLCDAVVVALQRGLTGTIAVAEPEPIAMKDSCARWCNCAASAASSCRSPSRRCWPRSRPPSGPASRCRCARRACSAWPACSGSTCARIWRGSACRCGPRSTACARFSARPGSAARP